MLIRMMLMLALAGITNLFAQNSVIDGGTLTGNIRWSGTVRIRGDVTIAASARLTIMPGTQVLFDASKDLTRSGIDPTRSELIIRGYLIAKGEIGNKITFSSAASSPRMGDWHGIQFLHVQTQSILDYIIVEYAHNGLTIKNSNIQITNSEIRYNFNAGILAEVKAAPKILHNIISENDYAGIVCTLGARPVLTGNLITLNRIGVVAFSASQPNLGSLRNDENYNEGKNRILENEDYNFYNHSNKPVLAENNSWGSTANSEIAAKIFDRLDDARYGDLDLYPLLEQGGSEPALGAFLLHAQNTEISAEPPVAESIPNTTPLLENNAPDQPLEERVIAGEQNPEPLDTTVFEFKIPESSVATSGRMLASAGGTTQPEADLALNNPVVEQKIDYEQIIMEPFLDSGKKIYINKPKLPMNDVIRQAMEPGEVRIKVVVRKDGTVEGATVLKGINRILDMAALETVRRFRYRPGTLNSTAVRFSTTEMFLFK
jgi:TonB family protein